jgi:hypothetical protein
MTSPAFDLPHARTQWPSANHQTPGLSVIKALKVALGATGLAIVAVGSVWLVTEPVETPARNKIRLAKAEAWPEIKDGVPAPAPATAAPVGEIRETPPAPAPAAPPLTAASQPAPSQAPPASSEGGPAQATRAAPERVPTDRAPAAARIEALSGSDTTKGAQIEPSAAGQPEAVAPAVAPPLPPPAPRRAMPDRTKPRKELASRPISDRTALARSKPAPKQEVASPAPPAEEARAAMPDDHIRVFGVQLPTGRDMKETFVSIGNAVMGR